MARGRTARMSPRRTVAAVVVAAIILVASAILPQGQGFPFFSDRGGGSSEAIQTGPIDISPLEDAAGDGVLIITDSAEDGELLDEVPAYDGDPYAVIDAGTDATEGTPSFAREEVDRAADGAFESYSPLDGLGRCGEAVACLGPETMPTRERGDISEIHPSGWEQEFYDFVDGEAVYNRCHLIAHSLSGEDANERNLITGTRTMNDQAMRPFEEEVARYIDDTGNHVLYRSNPVFDGDELVARGVQVEAFSIEDGGAGICFNIFCYDVEPGVVIDYATGENRAA